MLELKSSRFSINGTIYNAVGCRTLVSDQGVASTTDCLDSIIDEATGKLYRLKRSYILSKSPTWLPLPQSVKI